MAQYWIQNDVMINGAQMHYVRTGDGSRPALVLVHGFSDNGLCWASTARDLEAEYDVIMPDARGHGLSARVQPGEEVDLVADLAALIRHLGLKRPIVAGHSMGARTASQLAGRFPDLPRALILEDPPWREPSADAARATGLREPFDKWFREMAALSLDQVVEYNRADHPTWTDDVLRTWCEGKKQLDLNFFTIVNQDTMAWQAVVKAIACPVLLITADPDKGGIVTPELADAAASLNDNITVVHIPGTGHHIRFANYAAYMDRLRAFLASLDAL